MLLKTLKAYYNQWLDKRIPRQTSIELNQKRLFILPSKQGVYFLLVLLLLLIAGINYQNNLAYGLCFFLFSLLLTTIFMTFFNLKGLTIKAGKTIPAFVGEYAEFSLILKKSSTSQYHRLSMGFPDNPKAQCDLVLADELTINLRVLTKKRGRLVPGRYRIQTQYPLGMVTCWSYLALPADVIVYPSPQFLTTWPMTAVKGTENGIQASIGQDDFYGFKAYQIGDSPRMLNWRGLAKGQPINSKHYESHQDQQQWVDWYALSVNNNEIRLSLLCGWIITLNKKGCTYGLRLPGIEILPAKGEKHYHQLLSALAMYNQDAQS